MPKNKPNFTAFCKRSENHLGSKDHYFDQYFAIDYDKGVALIITEFISDGIYAFKFHFEEKQLKHIDGTVDNPILESEFKTKLRQATVYFLSLVP